MKKLIAIFAVLLLAAPAMAADWSFYGSQRMQTFYIMDDFGDYNQAGVLNGPGNDDDWGLSWNFQDNSRLGAKVKADKVSGQIELALNAADGNTGHTGGEVNGSNGGDGHVSARRAFGVWKFADNASLKVGKDYSPVSNLVSGQVFADDAGLLGNGDFYGKRPGQLGLQLGAFEIALITNALKDSSPADPINGVSYDITPAGTDLDWNVPKIEARYTFKAGMFELIPFGGFQYYKVSDNTSALTDDLDIYSYVGGLVARVNIGAFYIAAEGAYGQNWNNANWSTGLNPDSAVASGATLDGTDDVNDATSWQALILAGLNFTPTLKFEAGFGYREDDPDVSGVDEISGWSAYGQVVITLAPGVYLIPEGGYIDKGDDLISGDDQGYTWYAGAKWQIDF